MKIGTLLSVAGAFIALFALSSPAEAQHHGGGGHGGGSGHFGGGSMNHGHMGGGYGHGGNYHHGYGGYHGYYHGHSHVNFYFGGFGYPYYGDPYFGLDGYGYGYAPYGYGYYSAPIATYTYDPRGIYQGRVVRRGEHQLSVAAQVQQQLAAAGYYHGDIDGIIGAQTRRAIRNYERDNNLEVDGQIGNELLSTMGLG